MGEEAPVYSLNLPVLGAGSSKSLDAAKPSPKHGAPPPKLSQRASYSEANLLVSTKFRQTSYKTLMPYVPIL
jgi:hypothetical protein